MILPLYRQFNLLEIYISFLESILLYFISFTFSFKNNRHKIGLQFSEELSSKHTHIHTHTHTHNVIQKCPCVSYMGIFVIYKGIYIYNTINDIIFKNVNVSMKELVYIYDYYHGLILINTYTKYKRKYKGKYYIAMI